MHFPISLLALPVLLRHQTLTHASPLQSSPPTSKIPPTTLNTANSASALPPLTTNTALNLTDAHPYPSLPDLGMNCEGSSTGCVRAASANVLHTLRDAMSPLLLANYSQHIYHAGQPIACVQHPAFFFLVGGFLCAVLQGVDVLVGGVAGVSLVKKLEQLMDHGCRGCGNIPVGDDNDPHKKGVLTVNFMRRSECVGLCLYSANGTVTAIQDGISNGANGLAKPRTGVTVMPSATSLVAAAVSQSAVVGVPGISYSAGNGAREVTQSTASATNGGLQIASAWFLPAATLIPGRYGHFNWMALVPENVAAADPASRTS